jgi:hypothetical protein
MSETAQDAQLFSNISATTAAFPLKGGTAYGVTCQGNFGGGLVKLQVQAADGSTYLSVASATDFTSNGYASVSLPPGLYRWTVAGGATAIYCAVARIPV